MPSLDLMAARLYEIRKQRAELEREEQAIANEMKKQMALDEVIDVEGIPPLKLISVPNGVYWDSDAIDAIEEQNPLEWKRLRKLGLVKLDGAGIKDAIKRGELVKAPMGGQQKYVTKLVFER